MPGANASVMQIVAIEIIAIFNVKALFLKDKYLLLIRYYPKVA
jgi:hypothetical protein